MKTTKNNSGIRTKDRGFLKSLIFVFLQQFFCLLPVAYSFSQTPGEWTWMHGDSALNSLGVFGIQGVPSPTNNPPSVYEPCEWKDHNGNFWLLGGRHNISQEYTALWKYDPVVNQWSWMKGTSAAKQPGVYGTQGVSSPANYPGARAWGVATWVDTSGNLWLFGGYGYDAVGGLGRINDLWKYDIAANEWTWMKGPDTVNDPGSYGTKGVPNSANLPPPRCETSCAWTDNAGNLWLYGGQISTNTYYGDLWKYDIASNEWTWMHGANTGNASAVYGTQGVAAPVNTPGGRWVYCSWTDNAGNLWLFGGIRGSNSYLNDLWKYDIAANQWTWMKGYNIINNTGNYGAKCVPANNNLPPARMETRARVQDVCGNFWLLGGTGSGAFNDLWHYNITRNQWTWVSGDNIPNQTAVYGVQGISNPANKPGARNGNVAWIDNDGYIWVFGEMGVGGLVLHNDLFRYVPDTNCIPVCNTVFSTAVTSVNILCNNQCNGTAAVSASGGSPSYTYAWSPGGETTSSVTGLCAGIYTVTVTDAVSAAVTATVNITQPTALSGSVASANVSCNSLCNGTSSVTISGGTPNYTYSWNTTPVQTSANAAGLCAGNYTVTITDANGCTQTQTVTITQPAALTAAATSTATACGNNNGSAAANTGGGTSPYAYSWLPAGGTNAAATGLAAGTYTIIVTDTKGCTQTQTVTVAPSPPGPTANAAGNITITEGQSATLTASGGGTYSWSPATGLNCTTCAAVTATPLWGAGGLMYCITVTDSNNCTDTACVTITVEPIDCSTAGELYMPNAFSPNGDGENDVLKIYYGNMLCIKGTSKNSVIHIAKQKQEGYEQNHKIFSHCIINQDCAVSLQKHFL